MLAAVALIGAALAPEVAIEELLSTFEQTCLPARSLSGLTEALEADGWKQFSSLSESRLANVLRELRLAPNERGISPELKVYSRDLDERHFEIIVSTTPADSAGGPTDIGCRLYDFAVTSPIPFEALDAFADGATGQTSAMGDVQTKTWYYIGGSKSTMRATFIPQKSSIGARMGFTGTILGTNFPDGVE